jgi:type 1 glutamine amidotransferase
MKKSGTTLALFLVLFLSVVGTAFNPTPQQTEKRALAILGDNWHCVAPLDKHIVGKLKTAGYKTDVIIDNDVPFDQLDDYELVLISRYAWDDARRYREHAMGTPRAKEMRWISSEEENMLEKFVENGGSLFLHHDGIGNYPKGGGINRLSKAFFLNHPPITNITLRPTGKMTHLTEGLEEFTILDEEYNLELDESETEVFLESYSDEHGRYPQGWAHNYGKGKVVVFIPGHGWESLGNPMVEKSISNIVAWLGNGEI